MKYGIALAAAAAALALAAPAGAQRLDTRFSCSSTTTEDGERVIYSDVGEAHLNGNRIESFRWESSLFRPTYGFDCSIDDGDGLQAELMQGMERDAWRITLRDARAARAARGYDFERGLNCSIRLERRGDTLAVKPSCPAMCGSRANFTDLTVDLKTGTCHYAD
ncbi:MAG: hypothetical protein WA924_12570 [Burkholderiaceae bacterium]